MAFHLWCIRENVRYWETPPSDHSSSALVTSTSSLGLSLSLSLSRSRSEGSSFSGTQTENPSSTSLSIRQTCQEGQIEAYRKFPALYDERKSALSFPKEKQTLSFTDDLPAEIRLLVYGHLFKTLGNYFELWSAPVLYQGGARCKNAFNLYLKNRDALKILRLSKKVHEEAGAFFYGRNNFRFSDFDGFAVMAVFHHTIGQANCDFIKHVTVQIPSGERVLSFVGSYIKPFANERVVFNDEWGAFEAIQSERGMRIPDFGYSRRDASERRKTRKEFSYARAVASGWHQLQNMASLRTLEILIPWDYSFITGLSSTQESIAGNGWEERQHAAMVRNLVLFYSSNRRLWGLLKQLKEGTASEDLTISLILTESLFPWCCLNRTHDVLAQHRWLAEYAKVMGYRFGHTRWDEGNSTYVVQYDED